MLTLLPAMPSKHMGRAAWRILLLLAALLSRGLYLVLEHGRANDRMQEVLSHWAEEIPAKEALAQAALEELRTRLGPTDPWYMELDQDPQLGKFLIETYWSQGLIADDGGSQLHYRLDSFSVPLDEPRKPLRETLPSIRVVDLTFSVQVVSESLAAQGVIHIETHGAKLDSDAAALFREDFEARGVRVQTVRSE